MFDRHNSQEQAPADVSGDASGRVRAADQPHATAAQRGRIKSPPRCCSIGRPRPTPSTNAHTHHALTRSSAALHSLFRPSGALRASMRPYYRSRCQSALRSSAEDQRITMQPCDQAQEARRLFRHANGSLRAMSICRPSTWASVTENPTGPSSLDQARDPMALHASPMPRPA